MAKRRFFRWTDHSGVQSDGRNALVTGGETGPGRAAAIAFAREGADVAFTLPPAGQSDAEDVAQFIRDASRKAVPLPGDLRDEDFCNQLVADAVSALGGLDILVSNLTRQFHSFSDIAQMSTEQFDAAFKSNIYAMFWLTKAALPHMGPGSSIINTSSAGRECGCARADLDAADAPAAGPPTDPGADTCWRGGARQAELASTYLLLASDEYTACARDGAARSDPQRARQHAVGQL